MKDGLEPWAEDEGIQTLMEAFVPRYGPGGDDPNPDHTMALDIQRAMGKGNVIIERVVPPNQPPAGVVI